jgi:hypothetical protein
MKTFYYLYFCFINLKKKYMFQTLSIWRNLQIGFLLMVQDSTYYTSYFTSFTAVIIKCVIMSFFFFFFFYNSLIFNFFFIFFFFFFFFYNQLYCMCKGYKEILKVQTQISGIWLVRTCHTLWTLTNEKSRELRQNSEKKGL